MTVLMLDHLHAQLDERFSSGSQNAKHLQKFMVILPSEINGFSEPVKRSDIAEILEMYETDLPSAYAIDMELQAWCPKWHVVPKVHHSTQPQRH